MEPIDDAGRAMLAVMAAMVLIEACTMKSFNWRGTVVHTAVWILACALALVAATGRVWW